jgi:homocysteine S-methyltransferase
MTESHRSESMARAGGASAAGRLADALAVRVLVLDGGLATALEAEGLSLDDPLWSARALVEDRGALARVHQAFAAAGADVVCSASYQASRQGLAARGLDADEADALIAASVALAREAAPGALIAASFGSYGAVLHDGSEYRGDFSPPPEGLQGFHATRLRAAAAAVPDAFAFETVPSLAEVTAINAALDEVGARPGSAWVSCSLSADDRLGSGEPIVALADVAWSPAVAAIGFNCAGPAQIAAACERLGPLTDRPLVAYPNRGETWIEGAGWGAMASTRWARPSGSSQQACGSSGAAARRQRPTSRPCGRASTSARQPDQTGLRGCRRRRRCWCRR